MRNMKNMLYLAAMALVATPAFAQGGETASGGGFTLHVGFAMALASGLCGLAQGKAIAASAEGVARNPGAGGQIRINLLLGLAFIESLALFTFVKAA